MILSQYIQTLNHCAETNIFLYVNYISIFFNYNKKTFKISTINMSTYLAKKVFKSSFSIWHLTLSTGYRDSGLVHIMLATKYSGHMVKGKKKETRSLADRELEYIKFRLLSITHLWWSSNLEKNWPIAQQYNEETRS